MTNGTEWQKLFDHWCTWIAGKLKRNSQSKESARNAEEHFIAKIIGGASTVTEKKQGSEGPNCWESCEKIRHYMRLHEKISLEVHYLKEILRRMEDERRNR